MVKHFPFDFPPSPKSVRSYEKNHALFTFGEPSLKQQKQQLKQSQPNPFAPLHKYNVGDEKENSNHNYRPTLTRENINLLREITTTTAEESPNHPSKPIQMELEDRNKSTATTKVATVIATTTTTTTPTPDRRSRFDISLKSRNRFLESIKSMSSSVTSAKEKFSPTAKINSAPPDATATATTSNSRSSATAATVHQTEASSSSSGSGKNATQNDLTMFPFDREAIDYERIQRECFAVEPSSSASSSTTTTSSPATGPPPHHHRFPFNLDSYASSSYDDADDSPTYRQLHCCNDAIAGDPATSDYRSSMYEQYRRPVDDVGGKHPAHPTRYIERRSSAAAVVAAPTFRKYSVDLDAFSPLPPTSGGDKQSATTICGIYSNDQQQPNSVSKFEQIAQKFNQIPPKPLDAFNNHHQHHQTQNHHHHHQYQRTAEQQQQYHPSSKHRHHHQHHHHQHHQHHHHQHQQHQHQHHHHHQKQQSSQNPSGGTSAVITRSEASPSSSSAAAPLPNLRVDFFIENHHHVLLNNCQKSANHPSVVSTTVTPATVTTTTTSSVAATIAVINTTATSSSAATTTTTTSSTTPTGAINVTPNPMDTAVCTQPRATIVVQQVRSLSLYIYILFLQIYIFK